MKKGFTLIELLVVVAIIGILATVIISNLSQARLRAKDAAIKASFQALRTELELFYLVNDNYNINGTDLWTDFIAEIESLNGGLSVEDDLGNDQFEIIAPLASDPSTFVCIDLNGVHVGDNYSVGDVDGHPCLDS